MPTVSCSVDSLNEKSPTLTSTSLKSKAQFCSFSTVMELLHLDLFIFSWDSSCKILLIKEKNHFLEHKPSETTLHSSTKLSLDLSFTELDGAWEDWESPLSWFFYLWSQLKSYFTGDLPAWSAWNFHTRYSKRPNNKKWSPLKRQNEMLLLNSIMIYVFHNLN